MNYNFTSLPEFNAALKQFNIIADRGAEESFTFRKGGLLYRVLDKQGNKIGVPLKASALPGKPILKELDKKFAANKLKREIPNLALKKTLDDVLAYHPVDLKKLIDALAQNQVVTVLRQNAEGRIYGITYVDNKNRSVFNGSEIGKPYSIAGLQKNFTDSQSIRQQNTIENGAMIMEVVESLVGQLFDPIEDNSLTPYALKKKNKKKKGNK